MPGRDDRRRVDVNAWRDTIASPDGPTSPQVRLVLLCLSLHMKPDGAGAWPSQATLTARTGLGERTVRRCLERAEAAGWIAREYVRRDSGKNWRRTVYAATLPGAPTAPAQGPVTVAAPSARSGQSGPKVRSLTTQGPVTDDTRSGHSGRLTLQELSKNFPSEPSGPSRAPEGLARPLLRPTPPPPPPESPERIAAKVRRAMADCGDVATAAIAAKVSEDEVRRIMSEAAA